MPTDIVQIMARAQVFNNSDTAIAAGLLNKITNSPYNNSGRYAIYVVTT